MDFSSIGKELYEFIEKNTEVTIKMIREQLSEKHLGALGKLIGNGLVSSEKRNLDEKLDNKLIKYLKELV